MQKVNMQKCSLVYSISNTFLAISLFSVFSPLLYSNEYKYEYK